MQPGAERGRPEGRPCRNRRRREKPEPWRRTRFRSTAELPREGTCEARDEKRGGNLERKPEEKRPIRGEQREIAGVDVALEVLLPREHGRREPGQQAKPAAESLLPDAENEQREDRENHHLSGMVEVPVERLGIGPRDRICDRVPRKHAQPDERDR